MAEGRGGIGRALFISDVHLLPEGTPRAEERAGAFARFLNETASRAGPVRPAPSGARLNAGRGEVTTLYVLGDLFAYWYESGGRVPGGFARPLSALGEATAAGLRVVALPGNRDFLLGPAFRRETGAEVAPDELALTLGGMRVELVHGDTLALGDRRYRIWRRFSRGPGFRRFVRGIPAPVGSVVAGSLRKGSEFEKRAKTLATMGFSGEALRSRVARGADVVIAGHVHEPEERLIEAGSRTGRLLVLGSWDEEPGAYAEWDGERLRLVE